MPRILLAAPKSGSGKTWITCGLLQWLSDQNLDPVSFKCGPDYIDPLFHRTVLGVAGRNLDSFFSDEKELCALLAKAEERPAVLEGVMGLYDGIDAVSRRGSAYEIARLTQTPILLILDAKGWGTTLLALLRGLLQEDKAHCIRGIVLNRASDALWERLREPFFALLDEIGKERGVPVSYIGRLSERTEWTFSSRHLGLQLPEEIRELRKKIQLLKAEIDRHCDMKTLLTIMQEAPDLSGTNPEAKTYTLPKEKQGAGAFDGRASVVNSGEEELVLAVAQDEAFCFYYQENLEAFAERGVRLRFFSPLHDEALPTCDGLLLGGGYPELHAKALSRNESMRASIRQALENGLPSLAECGGFLFLQKELETPEGECYPMLGILPGRAVFTGSLQRFGYCTVTGKGLLQDLSVKGHEFHYYDTDCNGQDALAVKPAKDRSWPCLFVAENHIWGFPHLYYPSCPELLTRFLQQMRKGRKTN